MLVYKSNKKNSNNLGARVCLLVNGLQPLFGHVCVMLSRRKRLMAEKFLNRAQVASRVKEVCREGVPDHVRMDVAIQRGAGDNAVQDHPDGAGGETGAAGVQP